MSEFLNKKYFDPKIVERAMFQYGAVAVSMLDKQITQELLAANQVESDWLGGYETDVRFKHNFHWKSNTGIFSECANSLSNLINESYGPKVKLKNGRQFHFNEFSQLDYPTGSSLRYHYDAATYHIITCSVVLEGEDPFYTRRQELKNIDFHKVGGKPGDVIFMLEQGFDGTLWRTMHGIGTVKDHRSSVVFRYQN